MSTALDFVCGVMAGWSQVLVGQPLDFIKMKFQTSNSQNVSTSIFAKQIVKDHGLLGFYRGSSSLFFGFSFTVALEFAIYEACKKYLLKGKNNITQKTPQQVLSLKQIMVSGGFVGTCVSFVNCPVEYVKIQTQMNRHTTESSIKLLMRELFQNKMANAFKGISTTILREAIGCIFYYGSYEAVVRQVCYWKDIPRRFANYSDYMLAGSTAGLIYWTFAYPLDVIKTKIQSGSPKNEIFKNFRRNSYRGFNVIALRAIIVNGISFATFEQAKSLIQKGRSLQIL